VRFRAVRERSRDGNRPPAAARTAVDVGPYSAFSGLRTSQAFFDKVASGSYIASMRSVGIKVLKNKLSEYVRLAAGGETVLVTDRDRVVAEIGPPGPTRSPMLSDALLLEAVRQGWISPPVSVRRGPPARKPIMTIDELLSNLQRDRADR
jgi:antitoxin (DNA-binding transcriptional repressor) of toxin-antitoxin stability system